MSTENGAELPERESMDFDVVIVGAGPAGLAAAIRTKQIAAEAGEDYSVVVVEKGADIGAHILSGAVIDPGGLDALLPAWREDSECPLKTQVTEDQFLFLGPGGGIRLPNFAMPKLMNNHGNYIGSLGEVARWLAPQAEALGVEIYPGFAAAEVLHDDEGRVLGIATGDMGVDREGNPGPNFTRGMELRGKYTLFAEGARGHLTKQLIRKFDLDAGREPQKYGIGIKEVWEVAPEQHRPGLVQHSFGWPLDNRTGGGSWLYHYGENLVSVGFVIHLNYENPTLSPFDEMQRFKTHPMIAPTFEGGKRIGYGARAIVEGGWQSVPKTCLPRRLPRRRCGGLRQRAAYQGQPQRHSFGHAVRRASRQRPARGGAPMTSSQAMMQPGAAPPWARISSPCATSSRSGRNSARCSASGWAGWTCG